VQAINKELNKESKEISKTKIISKTNVEKLSVSPALLSIVFQWLHDLLSASFPLIL
jgi:hypothetical protein